MTSLELQFRSLEAFLKFYKKQKGVSASDSDSLSLSNSKQHGPFPQCHEITHTRIGGDQSSNIYGAAFCIPNEMMDEFYHHYYNFVFESNGNEYLTEKQIDSESAILIDLDLKYNGDVAEKQYTDNDIFSIVFCGYLEKLKEMLQFDDTIFYVYIFEKPKVNFVSEKGLTKDGIHIIIGLKLNRQLQMTLRQNMIEIIPSLVNIPIMNDWSNVIDYTITSGSTNWQLYGSKKPGHDAYQLSALYEVQMDMSDNEFKIKNLMKEEEEESFTFTKEIMIALSARNTNIPSFPIKQQYHQVATFRQNSKMAACGAIPYYSHQQSTSSQSGPTYNMNRITNQNELDAEIEKMIASLNPSTEYHVKETHEFAMILPECFYEPGSHLLNRKLAFALKNTDPRNFLTWVKVRSKADDFDYSSIESLYKHWSNHFNQKDYEFKGLTKRSIMFWAKEQNPESFHKLRKNTVDFFITQSLSTGLDYDFAYAIYQMLKGEYVCSQLVGKPTWYHFENHRWVKDKGNSLRLAISSTFYNKYEKKIQSLQKHLIELKRQVDAKMIDKSATETIEATLKIAEKNIKKLKQCSDKNNIYKELADIFYDKDFLQKMDKNKNLICFKNGVVDIKQRQFRDGYPDDYITKTTGIDYFPLDYWTSNAPHIEDSIRDFFEKVFPIESVRKYMMDHLASCLIGENINQTFTIYCGRGSNGKSLLTDFMAMTLGEYSGTVPVTLVTDKRSSIGSATSELMQLKGVRYAVMQEPSKDAKINEGIMKQLTGDSQMQARELYCESESFTIQFNLVVSLNELFKINSNDNGTWRRIRVVNFVSKFKDAYDISYNALKPDDDDEDDDESSGRTSTALTSSSSLSSMITDHEKFVFVKDPNLKDKLPEWAPCLASILVDRVFQTNGIVKSCKEVMEASDKYRRDQDAIAQFIKEKITKREGESLKFTAVTKCFKEFLKFNSLTGSSPKECVEFMKQNFTLSYDKKSFLNLGLVPDIPLYAGDPENSPAVV